MSGMIARSLQGGNHMATPSQSAVGDFYRQEYFLGEGEDLAEVKSLTASVLF